MEIFGRDEVPGCFAAAVRSGLQEAFENPPEGEEPPEDLKIGDPSFNRVSFADLGDETLAYRATIPFSIQRLNFELYLDFVVVRVGRAEVSMTFQSPMSPFQTEEAERLTQHVVERIAADA